MNPSSLQACLLVLSVFPTFLSLSAAQVHIAPAIYVFGDSTVDAGNNNFLATIVRANFPPYGRDFNNTPTGRFCNGRVSTDYISSFLGLPFPPAYLDPQAEGSNIIQGVNFATSGSGFFERTAVAFNVPGLLGQLEWFKQYKQKLIRIVGQERADDIVSKALFAISTGSNDYINNYYVLPKTQAEFDRDTYRGILIESFENFVKLLYEQGARRMAVVSLAPMGCIPAQITLFGKGEIKCLEFENQDALLFNMALKSSVETLKLSSGLSGIKLAYIDIYTLFMDVFSNPSKYGFYETLRGCCGIGRLAVSILCNEFTKGTCTDASKYVFWDSFHPTDAMNKYIAKAAIAQGFSVLI